MTRQDTLCGLHRVIKPSVKPKDDEYIMMIEIISQSAATPYDKNKAIQYLELCKKMEHSSTQNTEWDNITPYGGMVPSGAVEFFKVILQDIPDGDFLFSKQVAEKFINLQFSGGEYDAAYDDLQRLSANDFAVDDFRLVIDGNANPYLGYIEFFHKGKNWHYAPDTFEAPFEVLIFKFLNYFLSVTEMSNKRFFTISCTSVLSEGSAGTEGVYFITHEQFLLLDKYHFLTRPDKENAFWIKTDGVVFRSVEKDY